MLYCVLPRERPPAAQPGSPGFWPLPPLSRKTSVFDTQGHFVLGLPRERPPAPRLVAPLSHGRPVSESQEAFCMVEHKPPETRPNRHFHPSRIKRPFLTPKKHFVRKNTRKRLGWLVWLAGLDWAGGWLAAWAGRNAKEIQNIVNREAKLPHEKLTKTP